MTKQKRRKSQYGQWLWVAITSQHTGRGEEGGEVWKTSENDETEKEGEQYEGRGKREEGRVP